MDRLIQMFPDRSLFDLAVALEVVMVRRERRRRTATASREFAAVMGYEVGAA